MGLSGGIGPGACGLLVDCSRFCFRSPRISALLGIEPDDLRHRTKYDCIAQSLRSLCSAWRPIGIAKEDERRILRCAACDGTVFAEIAGFGRADANTACASCGMTLVNSPFSGGDYFDVIMRVGRPIWRGARRRAG